MPRGARRIASSPRLKSTTRHLRLTSTSTELNVPHSRIVALGHCRVLPAVRGSDKGDDHSNLESPLLQI